MSTSSTSATAIDPTGDPVDVNQDEHDLALFLRAHRLKSFTTPWRWKRLLRFKYDTRRKSFYVGGHECEDVVAHRNVFCKN